MKRVIATLVMGFFLFPLLAVAQLPYVSSAEEETLLELIQDRRIASFGLKMNSLEEENTTLIRGSESLECPLLGHIQEALLTGTGPYDGEYLRSLRDRVEAHILWFSRKHRSASTYKKLLAMIAGFSAKGPVLELLESKLTRDLRDEVEFVQPSGRCMW